MSHRALLRRIVPALLLVLFLCLPCQAEKLRFAVMGDSRGATVEQPVNRPVLDEIVARILALDPKPNFMLFTGDLVMRSKQDGRWMFEEWAEAVRPLGEAGIKVLPVIGNHELYQEQKNVLHLESQQAYQKAFAAWVPQNGPKGYESLVYSVTSPGGDVFLSVFDSYYIDPSQPTMPYSGTDTAVTQAQINWLAAQLKSTKAKFKIAALHVPIYSPRRSARPDCGRPEDCALWRIFDQSRFAMVLAGHVHLYSRKAIGPDVDPKCQNGVFQVIAGGAGAPLDKRTWEPHAADKWHLSETYHYLVVDIDGDTLTAQAIGKVDGDWREIDSFMFQSR